MQIPVKCGCGGCEEWAMVELQGSLDIQHATNLQNLSIGSLCHTSAVTTHTLTPLTSHNCRCFVFFGWVGGGFWSCDRPWVSCTDAR
jgi:hypothetical protein